MLSHTNVDSNSASGITSFNNLTIWLNLRSGKRYQEMTEVEAARRARFVSDCYVYNAFDFGVLSEFSPRKFEVEKGFSDLKP